MIFDFKKWWDKTVDVITFDSGARNVTRTVAERAYRDGGLAALREAQVLFPYHNDTLQDCTCALCGVVHLLKGPTIAGPGASLPQTPKCEHSVLVYACPQFAPDGLPCAFSVGHQSGHSNVGSFRNDRRPYCTTCNERINVESKPTYGVYPNVSILCGNCSHSMPEEVHLVYPWRRIVYCTNPQCQRNGVKLEVKPVECEVVE